jgi:predicted site-specific integrase-resolvase
MSTEKVPLKGQIGSHEFSLGEIIYNTDELMKLLKVSRRTVQNWRDEGTIEFSQINGKIYYRMSAIAKMLDQNLIKK